MSFAFILGSALALPSPALSPVVAWGFSIMYQSYYDFVQQVAYNDNVALFGPLHACLMGFEIADHLASGQPLRPEYQVFLSSPVHLGQ